MKRTTILVILGIIVVVGGIVGYRYYSGTSFIAPNPEAKYELATVQKGTLIQEVSASGKVAPPETLELQFKNSDKLVALKAKVGKEIKAGNLLAKQDTGVLEAQLAEMQAGIDVQKAKLDQLHSGASPEDIAVAETAVANAEISVANARQSLDDAKQNLIDKLRDAYTKSDDAVRGKADQFFNNPRTDNPQISFFVIESQLETDVEWGRLLMEYQLKKWKTSIDQLTITGDLATYLDEARKNLGEVKSFLDKVALAVNNPNNKPNSVSQTTYDGWRTDVATARTNVNTALANLSAAEEKLRTEESDLKTAEGSLKTAQDQLTLKKAPARSPDVALYEAQIRQAEAQMQKIEAQIQEMVLTSPVNGVITEVNGNVGESIKSDAVVVRIIPTGVLQVDVNISEADIVDIKIDQEAKITLDAFDDEMSWPGKVAKIDPAETIIGGAVYYKTTVLFVDHDERIKPGMTANIWIKTAQKPDALFIPRNVIKEKEGKKFIEVLEGSRIQEKEVKTGMKGEGGMIEILSSINEGKKVIVGIKKQ